jgi:hypothetical protein
MSEPTGVKGGGGILEGKQDFRFTSRTRIENDERRERRRETDREARRRDEQGRRVQLA